MRSEVGMTTPQQRREVNEARRLLGRERAAGHKGQNGTGVDALSPEETEELRQLLQPSVMQFQMAQGIVAGYLTHAGFKNARYSIDFATGIVTLTAPPVPEPVAAPPAP